MYIPGFSNMLTQRMARGGTPRSHFADADGFMYDPEMGFMSEDMGGPAYVDFTQYVDPQAEAQAEAQARAQAEAQAQAEAEARVRAQMAEASAPEEEYLNPFDAEAYESNAAPLSQSGRVQQYTPPVAGATPQYTQGGMLVFNNHQGGMGGFAAPIEGATYALIDNKTGKVVTSGTGQAGLEQVWRASNDRSADMGKKANWTVVGVDPTSGRQFNVAEDTPPASALGIAADFVLPAIGGAIAGPLGAAAGSGVSSVAQGRSIEDTLLRAGITAGSAALIGGAPGMDSAASSKAAAAASSAASSKLSPLLGEIIVQGTTAAVPALVGSAAGGALSNFANMTPGRGTDYADRVFEQPTTPAVQITPEGEMILTAQPQVGGALPVASAGASVMANAALNSLPEEVQQLIRNNIQVEQQRPTSLDNEPALPLIPNIPLEPVFTPDLSPEIVVEADRPTSLDNEPALPLIPNIPLEPIFTPDLSPEIVVEAERSVQDEFDEALSGVPAPTITPEGEMVLTGERPTSFDNEPSVPVASVLPDLTKTPVLTPDLSPEIVVQGSRQVGGALPGAAAGADAMVRAGLGTLAPDVQQLIQNNIQVEQKRNAVRDEFDTAFGVGAGEIVVPGKRPTSFDNEPSVPVAPVLPDLTKTPVDVGGPKKDLGDQLKDRLKDLGISDYLQLAALLAPLLGGGGGGRPAPGRIPAGLSSGFSPSFSGGLPRATLPGASTGFAPRAPATLGPQTTQDWYRYGYGPSQSFFSYVPQGAPNTSRAFTGYEQAQAREDKGFYLGGMAGGGDMSVMPRNSFAVNGPGSGRSDEIPAMLSDGEYVMDAETVALLGDGSPQAGADRLDKFRKNVRQHKARKLAKGEFSDNAKSPEHYLKGGRK